MNKYILIALALLLILFFSGYWFLQLSKSRTFQFFGGLISRVETKERVVALTFDDAPNVYSDEVLKTLKDKDIRATFCVIGKAMEEYPEAGKNIVRAGHELGNHSFSHQRLLFKSLTFIDGEIQRTNKLIAKAGSVEKPTFRPPYGK